MVDVVIAGEWRCRVVLGAVVAVVFANGVVMNVVNFDVALQPINVARLL